MRTADQTHSADGRMPLQTPQGSESMKIYESRLEAAFRSGGTSSPHIYRPALRVALDVKPDAGNILDFGAGIGEFIDPIRAAFPRSAICAADIMQRPAGLSRDIEWEQSDLNLDLGLPDSRFDIAFAIEVIEHLENPRHVLRELYRVLRPGGVAVITTPNTASIRSHLQIVVRGHFAEFDDSNYPQHITPVGPVDFKRMSGEAGFRRHRFFYTDVGCIPKLLKWKWQQIPAVGKMFRGRLFSDNYGVVLWK